ncbi:MAG TPA: GNAT family N-acetyltransferase [Rhodocyclaceae bacterium]
MHLHLARAVASGSVKAATGKVEICRDQALASDVGGDAHPMRFPLFTLARTPDQRKQVFRATYRGSEACYSVNFIRHATNITFVNSYAEIPSPVFLCIVQAVLRRLIWTSSIRSQRNITSYASFMRTDAMDEYVAELTCGAEAYRASLGKKTRFNTRYYWDRLQADFPGITALPFDRGELAHGDFAHFVSLVEKRYPGGYWSGFLPEPVFTLFRENVVGLIVRNQGKPIAFNIFYRHADDLIFTGNVFDDSYDKYSLGFVTTYMSIIQAAKQGIAKVILGGGDFGYKSRLSTASRPVSESFM